MKPFAIVFVALAMCALHGVDARTTRVPRRTTTTVGTTTTTSTTVQPVDDVDVVEDVAVEDEKYHPAEVKKPRLIERVDQRFLDGHYEFRYVLSNGDTRYERSYWQKVGKDLILARKGYYSYPLPDSKYMTVFYTADENGLHEQSATYSAAQPVLPRSLDAPESEVVPTTVKPVVPSVTTKKPVVSPVSVTKRPVRPFKRPVGQKKNVGEEVVTEVPAEFEDVLPEEETVV